MTRLLPRWLLYLAAILPGLPSLTGCAEVASRPDDSSPVPASEEPSLYEPATTGTIRGRVQWEGAPPVVEPFLVRIDPLIGRPFPEKQTWANPNVPRLVGQGVQDAVVFLRGVDGARSKPWDLGTPVVEMLERRLRVRQANAERQTGFVRVGQTIAMSSLDPVHHSLHADGAAYFTLPFAVAHRPTERAMNQPGLVELSSGSGAYWMRAYLFVDDHPYYAHTDAQGRFELRDLPPGRYELVAWLPNWKPDSHERDPDYSIIWTLRFRRPVEKTVAVTLAAREDQEVEFTFSGNDF